MYKRDARHGLLRRERRIKTIDKRVAMGTATYLRSLLLLLLLCSSSKTNAEEGEDEGRASQASPELADAGPLVIDVGQVESTTIQVDSSGSNTDVIVRFRFRNPYDVPLTIVGVNSSCSCAKAVIASSSIPTSGDIQVETRIGVGDRAVRGETQLAVQFEEDVPPVEFHLILLRSFAPYAIPSYVDFGGNAVGGAVRHFQVIASLPSGQDRLRVAGAPTCNDNRITCRLSPSSEKCFQNEKGLISYQATFEVILPKTAPSDPRIDAIASVALRCGDHKYELEVPLRGEWQQAVAARPTKILFFGSANSKDAVASKQIVLYRTDKVKRSDDFQISCSDPRIKAVLLPNDAEPASTAIGTIRVSLDEQPKQSFTAHILARCDTKEGICTLTIPVLVRVIGVEPD
jgi:hypothetical protein